MDSVNFSVDPLGVEEVSTQHCLGICHVELEGASRIYLPAKVVHHFCLLGLTCRFLVPVSPSFASATTKDPEGG